MKWLILFTLLIIIFSFNVVAQEDQITQLQQQIQALRAELQNQVREKQQFQLELENLQRKESGGNELFFISLFVNLVLLILVIIAFLPKKKKQIKNKQGSIAPKSTGSQLYDYISSLLDKGYQYSEIKKFLIKNGWDEESIEKAYRQI